MFSSGDEMTRVVPKKKEAEKRVHTGLVVPPGLLVELDEIAEEEGYSRNDVVIHMLRWAIAAHREEQKALKR